MIVLLVPVITFAGKFFPFPLVDFMNYWAAGYVFIEKMNPYDLENLLLGQQATGQLPEEDRLGYYYLYPPWTMALIAPFSLMDFRTSQVIWYLASMTALFVSATLLWTIYGGARQQKRLSWLLALSFAPVVFSLYFGQVTPFSLLAFTVFLILTHQKRQSSLADFIAGFILLIPTFKPTQIFLFWFFLLTWSYVYRRWFILAGLAASVIVSSILCTIINPSLYRHFFDFIRSYSPTEWGVPTLGVWLRRMVSLNLVWLQFAPAFVGFGWSLLHWFRTKVRWNWSNQLPMILFVSLLTTPYSWSHDQMLLLLAVIQIAALISVKTTRLVAFIGLFFWVGFNIFLFVFHLGREDALFIWQAPVLFGLYFILLRSNTTPVPLVKFKGFTAA